MKELFKNAKRMTIGEFNNAYGVKYQGKMEIEKFIDYIESEGMKYLYASYCANDVATECEILYEEMGLEIDDVVCVDGLYLALFK